MFEVATIIGPILRLLGLIQNKINFSASHYNDIKNSKDKLKQILEGLGYKPSNEYKGAVMIYWDDKKGYIYPDWDKSSPRAVREIKSVIVKARTFLPQKKNAINKLENKFKNLIEIIKNKKMEVNINDLKKIANCLEEDNDIQEGINAVRLEIEKILND